MFRRTTSAAKKTYRYVKDDVLNAEEVKGHFEDFKNLAREHADPRGRKSGRNETFAHAVERMGLSADDVAASYRNHSFRFYLFAFFFGIAAAMLVWGAVRMNWLLLPTALGSMAIFVGQMFNASFRCYQIRHHELLPVKSWWNHKHEWMPGEYTPPRSSSRQLARKDR